MISKIKIISLLAISLFTVVFLAPQVFISNTPKVNPLFITRIINVPSYVAGIPGQIMVMFRSTNSDESARTVLSSIPQVTPPPGLLFQMISKGVRAAEDPATKTKYMQIDAGAQVEVSVIKLKDGREIKIVRPATEK